MPLPDEKLPLEKKLISTLDKSKKTGLFKKFSPEVVAKNVKDLSEFYYNEGMNYEALLVIFDACKEPKLEAHIIVFNGVLDKYLTAQRKYFSDEQLEEILKNFIPQTSKHRKRYLQLFNEQLDNFGDNLKSKIALYIFLKDSSFYEDFSETEKRSLIDGESDCYIKLVDYANALSRLQELTIDSHETSFNSKLYIKEYMRLIIKRKLLLSLLNKSEDLADEAFRALVVKRCHQSLPAIEVSGLPDNCDTTGCIEVLAVAKRLDIELLFPFTLRAPLQHLTQDMDEPLVADLDEKEVSAPLFMRDDFDFEPLGVVGYQPEIKLLVDKVFKRRLLPQEIANRLELSLSKGVLLFGPPGNGKTLIARVVAQNYFPKEQVIVVNGPELKSRFVGQSAENLRQIFREAQKHRDKIYVYIFDEIDSSFTKRSSEESVGARVSNDLTSQFLTLLDGVNQLNNVIIIGTTNFKENLDTALLRSDRLETHILIGLPTLADRKALLHFFMKPLIREGIVDTKIDIEALAHLSQGFSCADIKRVINDAKDGLLDVFLAGGFDESAYEDCDMSGLSLDAEDFEQAILSLKLSRVSATSLKEGPVFFKPKILDDVPTLTRANSCVF